MCAAHKENKAPDFFPLRNKLFMPNMKNGTILDTEKNKIDLGDSPAYIARLHRYWNDFKNGSHTSMLVITEDYTIVAES